MMSSLVPVGGKWPDCADEVPYDFQAECAKAQDVPKEDCELPAS
jgi:hypothetical protein